MGSSLQRKTTEVQPSVWQLRDVSINLDAPIVMGILNTTPDSFSDGGAHADFASAVAAGLEMVQQGASIVDVGGESTRPGATDVSATEELARVLPVIEQLASKNAVVSVDTSKPQVAEAAVAAGAVIVNDVTGLEDAEMRSVCAANSVGVVAMHMQGTPRTMQRDPQYTDVVSEVNAYLIERAEACVEAGIARASIALDPGIGFGKTPRNNIDLLANLDTLCASGYPVLVGTSRKGFLGTILEDVRGSTTPSQRDGATAATIALAVRSGVKILRVHNVRLAVEVAHTANAIVPHDGKETDGA